MLKKCLLIKKLIEDGECKYSKILNSFIDINAVYRKNNKITVNDETYINEFYKKHCKDIIHKFEILKKENINITNIETLEKVWLLINYFKNNKDCYLNDIRHLSSIVYGNSKTLPQNKILKNIYQNQLNSKNNYYNITHIKSDKDIYYNNLRISDIVRLNGFFSCFTNKLNMIDIDAEYIVIFENLFPFFKLNCNNSLFIYSGGFQNINSISEYLKENCNNKKIIHFGDVDQSGLLIADKILSKNENSEFYPDLTTIKEIKNNLDKPGDKEKDFNSDNLFSEKLKEIVYYMKKNFNVRIEQEAVTTLIEMNKIQKPLWCNI